MSPPAGAAAAPAATRGSRDGTRWSSRGLIEVDARVRQHRKLLERSRRRNGQTDAHRGSTRRCGSSRFRCATGGRDGVLRLVGRNDVPVIELDDVPLSRQPHALARVPRWAVRDAEERASGVPEPASAAERAQRERVDGLAIRSPMSADPARARRDLDEAEDEDRGNDTSGSRADRRRCAPSR